MSVYKPLGISTVTVLVLQIFVKTYLPPGHKHLVREIGSDDGGDDEGVQDGAHDLPGPLGGCP